MPDIYKKQYLLSSKMLHLPDMQMYPLENAYLYVHPQLSCFQGVCGNGKTVTVLGNAYCMDRENKTVAEDVTRWDGADPVQLTRYWTGRYVVIADDRLITDACALMSAFYKVEQSGWMVSSSLAVIAAQYGLSAEEPCTQIGLQWQILPKTRVRGIDKLLCTQSLTFSKETIVIRPYVWMEDLSSATTNEKVAKLSRLLITACHNIAEATPAGILLALTGGKDSRLVLAALLAAKVPFKAYTAAYPNISQSDKNIPVMMCRDLGISHTYVKRGKLDKVKEDAYRIFTCEDTNGLDEKFYAFGQFDAIPSDCVVLRSGIFEAGQSYGRTIAGNSLESFVQGFSRCYAQSLQKETQTDAFAQWVRWAEETPIPYVDIWDRFYLEQRVGGWASAIEQSLDLNDFISIQIANCPRLISVLLAATDAERKQLSLSIESIRYMQETLLQYPINKRNIWDKAQYVFAIARNPVKKFKNLINKHRRK